MRKSVGGEREEKVWVVTIRWGGGVGGEVDAQSVGGEGDAQSVGGEGEVWEVTENGSG